MPSHCDERPVSLSACRCAAGSLQTKAELANLPPYDANFRELRRRFVAASGGDSEADVAWFRHQPIADQKVGEDELVDALVNELLDKVAAGAGRAMVHAS